MEEIIPSHVNNRSEKWPNFFIIGAARAGTTTLYDILSQMPAIYMSPFKEPEYFAPNSPTCIYHRYYSYQDNYLKLFKDADDAVAIGEASTAYLWDANAAPSIHDKMPSARIIAILRNPIDRAYSDYLQDIYLRNIKMPFEQALHLELEHKQNSFSYIRNGFYSQPVSLYYSLFGKNKVKIIIFEEYVKNMTTAVNEVLEFLEVPHRITKTIDEKHNSYMQPRGRWASLITSSIHTSPFIALYHHLPYNMQLLIADNYKKIEKMLFVKRGEKKEMSSEARDLLKSVYQQDVQQLEKVLERKLPWRDFGN